MLQVARSVRTAEHAEAADLCALNSCLPALVPSGFARSCAPLLDHRLPIAGEKQLAMRPPRRDSVGHHPLVELAEIEPAALSLLVIAPQFERGHLPEEIAAVGGVVGAADRFLPRRRRR